MPPALSLPLAVCSPTAYNGWTYTQKHNALAVSGKLSVHGQDVSLQHALGSYDFSAGYMRRDTSWRWASINTQTNFGTLGLNLAAGVNETGLTENALWINGERHLLSGVQFDFNRMHDNHAWSITSHDGSVALRFIRNNVVSGSNL